MRHLKDIARRLARAPRWMWSQFVAGYLRLRGVRVGRQCRFYGIPRVHRARGASISLGHRCVIRSASGSNRYSRGLPTVLSAVVPGAVLTLGEGVRMSDSVIVCTTSVSIGAETLLGAETLVTDTDSHPACPECRSAGNPASTGEVLIGRECFIGARSIILKGVVLAPGTCVGAGSIVTEGCCDCGGVLAGVPARAVRHSSRCTSHQARIEAAGSAHRS